MILWVFPEKRIGIRIHSLACLGINVSEIPYSDFERMEISGKDSSYFASIQYDPRFDCGHIYVGF